MKTQRNANDISSASRSASERKQLQGCSDAFGIIAIRSCTREDSSEVSEKQKQRWTKKFYKYLRITGCTWRSADCCRCTPWAVLCGRSDSTTVISHCDSSQTSATITTSSSCAEFTAGCGSDRFASSCARPASTSSFVVFDELEEPEWLSYSIAPSGVGFIRSDMMKTIVTG